MGDTFGFNGIRILKSEKSKKVLLIGWDAADWNLINPLVDQGLMPNVAYLIQNGTIGSISTLFPPISPMLWTSIATGKRPHKHGICGFVEPNEDRATVRPISNLNRTTKAIWNILNQNGKRSVVVGWWPSHPAEPIEGVMVSDMFYDLSGKPGKDWPLVEGACWPSSLAESLGDLRVHPSDLTIDDIRPFIPNIDQLQASGSSFPGICAARICDATTIQTIATELLETQDWDFAAVYFDAIDHFCHTFMKFHPPKLDWVGEEDYSNYKNVVNMAYQFHDMMLGELLRIAGQDCNIVLVSDHGFQSDNLRLSEIPNEEAGPTAEHREFGVFLVSGPGIKKDHLIHGASVLDVTPTVLQLFGLPVGRDMDGRVLIDVFQEPQDIGLTDSWDKVDGQAGLHNATTIKAPKVPFSNIDQLIDLGYVDPSIQTAGNPCLTIERENEYNRGLSLIGGSCYQDAAGIFLKLCHKDSSDVRFLIKLAVCLEALGRFSDMEKVVDHLELTWKTLHYASTKRVMDFYEHLQATKPPTDLAEQQPLLTIDDIGISPHEFTTIQALVDAGKINVNTIASMRASLATRKGSFQEAVTALDVDDVSQQPMVRSKLLLQQGITLLAADRLAEAETAFSESLRCNPDSSIAMLSMGRVFLRKKKLSEAIEWFSKAIGLQYHFPAAHFFHGMALAKAKKSQEAISALLKAVEQNYMFPQAHRLLGKLYEIQGDFGLSAKHVQSYERTRKSNSENRKSDLLIELPPIDEAKISERLDKHQFTTKFNSMCLFNRPCEVSTQNEPIIIVSGLPRSGTSMMMQMLVAGGMTPCADLKRSPDESNPKGYFEYEKTLKLFANNSWLADSRNKVIKIIAPLLPLVPQGENYKVILMRRDIDEIVDSQITMLSRVGAKSSIDDRDSIRSVYLSHFDKVIEVCSEHRIPLIVIDYAEVIANPESIAKQLCSWVDMPLEISQMISAVDPKLYREQRPPKK